MGLPACTGSSSERHSNGEFAISGASERASRVRWLEARAFAFLAVLYLRWNLLR